MLSWKSKYFWIEGNIIPINWNGHALQALNFLKIVLQVNKIQNSSNFFVQIDKMSVKQLWMCKGQIVLL